MICLDISSENIENSYAKAGALEATNVTLTVSGGTEIKQPGKTKIFGSHKGKCIKCTFYVIDSEDLQFLG